MSIFYNEENQMFHLQTNRTSYVMQVLYGNLGHLYWGRKIKSKHLTNTIPIELRAFTPQSEPDHQAFSLDTFPQEFPSYGTGDFRHPAFHVQYENGSTASRLRYVNHSISKGKSTLPGLPATYVENEKEADTLEIELRDSLAELKVILTYTVFEDFDVITRSVQFVNEGRQSCNLLTALSCNVDMSRSDFDLLHLSGAWGKERHVQRRSLCQGTQSIESSRGASSHQQNPFIALLSKNTDEDHGEVFGFSLVYSGNFIAHVEVDPMESTRVSMGINPFDFSWRLESGETFQTPEVVMVYSSEGIGEMSRIYHRFYRKRLCRGMHRDSERPILVNNWEATYFDFDEEKIKEIAEIGRELGIELFVLDDGWFGNRNNDSSSLGDWFVNQEKLPSGLSGLAGNIVNQGTFFGLWVEPEMVSSDSELYRKHPDWCLHVPKRERTESRNQLVLDLSREDVCDYLIDVLSQILASADISYVKWDMNRHMTEIGSALLPAERQRETAHRYILGLYRVMNEITRAFPYILFESCSGGGGRFDPGMLYYMPQTWTSDNTDAVSRLSIQYGTSLVYPAITMGSHVSAVPNHQVNRYTPLEMRGHVAMAGNFGYELDLTKMDEKEREVARQQVEFYKEIRPVIQFGDVYRLLSPFEGTNVSWMYVSEDKQEAVVFYYQILSKPNQPLMRLRLNGLNWDFSYEVIGTTEAYRGDELMHMGLLVPDLAGDYKSTVWRLKAT